jgi:phytoene dehydrogenase-like protein
VSGRHVVIVGAGIGGLSAAARLAGAGHRVTVLEAREDAGGLAAPIEAESRRFDAGPYIVLDRPGLAWAFASIGLRLDDELLLQRVDRVYEVAADGAPPVRFLADRAATEAGLEADWPGAGARYGAFVDATAARYARLQPMLLRSRPRPWHLASPHVVEDARFLLSGLERVLSATGLPRPVQQAIGIWTHIAGQRLREAPSPLAFVPALIHTAGCYYPRGGVAAVPRAIEQRARTLGVTLRFGARVRRIVVDNGVATGVELDGERIAADAVVSNYGGVGTYLELMRDVPAAARRDLEALPLQSPGVCAYLLVRPRAGDDVRRAPYLRFRLPDGDEPCRLLIRPDVLGDAGAVTDDGWRLARLMSPMRYADATRVGAAGQDAYLDRILDEPWWRESFSEARVVARRTPTTWGRDRRLYRDSMNPVMTARFMRRGRLAHRSPHVGRLYLVGSATHPGQWMSFCAVSGVLAADLVVRDVPPC